MLLNQLGVTDPETLQGVGQEEYELAAERTQNRQSLKRLTKAILRMTAAWGLESGFRVGADAMEVNEVCLSGQASGNNGGNQWLWLGMFLMLLMVVCGKQLQTWLTAGDRLETKMNTFISKQESRIDTLIQKCESLETQLQQVLAELKDEIQRVSNETSMVHDYAAGIHHSLVERGGFLRNGLGLSHQQMVHLATFERANLVTARVMGSVEYMRNLRKRYMFKGHADETDTIPMET